MSKRDRVPASRLLIAILPLVLFLALAGVFYSLLTQEGRKTSDLPSALLNRPAPQLDVSALEGSGLPGIEKSMFAGKISVVNVFASWCVPCRQEHPQILHLASDGRFQIIGINQRDKPENALKFLRELGNPYHAIGVDPNARVSIEWGVYGVPETFLVDQKGIIFYKHVGPIDPQMLEQSILPLLNSRLETAGN